MPIKRAHHSNPNACRTCNSTRSKQRHASPRMVHIYIHQKRPTFLSKEPYIFVAEGCFRVISIKKIKEIPHITESERTCMCILQNTLHFHPKPPILPRKEPSITPATAHIKVMPRITAGEFVYISVKRALHSCQKSPIFLPKYL